MNLLNKPKVDFTKKILESLKDKKPKSFTELMQALNINGRTLSKYLKQLQIQKMILRDIETRKYEIQSAGLIFAYKFDCSN